MINKKVWRGNLGCGKSTIDGLYIVSAIDDYHEESARVVLDANHLKTFVSDLIGLLPEEDRKDLLERLPKMKLHPVFFRPAE